jgi:hypothetical protein
MLLKGRLIGKNWWRDIQGGQMSGRSNFLAESQDISPKALAVNSYSEEQATLDPVRNISVRRAAFNRPKQQIGKDMANV